MTEQGTVLPRVAPGSEEQALLKRLRAGEDAAFGELFELHASAVRRLALGLANDRSEAEDITAETFFRVLQALRRGAGPKDHVRAYLLTVARRVSWEWHGARRELPVSDDELTHRAGVGADTNARTAEHSLITTAFTSLPERWRTVLWQTEVEGEQPAVVAPHFGLSANATAALARRARLGLRAAYLQAHLAVNRSSDGGCRTVMEKLGGYTAGSVTGAEARRIRAHLLGCSSCRSMHAELRDVCSSLRAHAGVLIMLVPASGLTLSGASSSVATTAGSGLSATVKGLLLGSKMKVGVALASTAAAGAFGIAVGPALIDSEHSTPIGLPGGPGNVELRVTTPAPPPVQQPPQIGADHNVITFPGAGPARDDHSRRTGSEGAANKVPTLPGEASGGVANSGAPRELPGTHERTPQPGAPESGGTGTPRIDTGDPKPSDTTTMSTTEPDGSSSSADPDESSESPSSGKVTSRSDTEPSSESASTSDESGGATTTKSATSSTNSGSTMTKSSKTTVKKIIIVIF